MREADPEKLKLLYERFRDVCLVEKEVWKEIYMPRDPVAGGPVLTRVQDRYDVLIEDPAVENAIEDAIPFGSGAVAAAIDSHRAMIGFVKRT